MGMALGKVLLQEWGQGRGHSSNMAPRMGQAGCSSAWLFFPTALYKDVGKLFVLLEKPGLDSGHPCASPQGAHTSLLFTCRMCTEGK